jgi:glycosyltransferase 2 family protein
MLRKKSLFMYLKLGFTAVLVLYVIQAISFDDFGQKLNQFDWMYLPIIFIIVLLFLFLGACNMYCIIRPLKNISFFRVLKIHFITVSFGMFTPSYIGEFGSATFLLHKEGLSVSEGLSVPSIDKMLTLCVNISLFLIGLWLFFPETSGIVYLIMIVAIITPLVTIFVRPVRNFVKFRIIERFFSWSTDYFTAIVQFLLNHTGYVAINLFCTLLRALLGALEIWLGIIALGISANLVPVMFVNFVARIVSYIPITVNGLGLLEGTAITLFHRINVASEVTLVAFLLPRLVGMFIGGIIVLVFLWNGKSVHTPEGFTK